MVIENIPAFTGTPAVGHPRVDEIQSQSMEWMCETGLLPAPELRARYARERLGAWPSHCYPYTSFDYGLLLAHWWSWWACVDDLALQMECDQWLKLSLDMERVIRCAGDGEVRTRGSDSVQPLLLRSLAELCRRTAAAGSDAYYQQVAAGSIDALYGFNLEALNERLRRKPDIDLELSKHCEYFRGRYKTIGLILDVAYIEGALGYDVPHAVRRTTAWQDTLETAFSVMILQNDLVGAARDDAAGDSYNAVNLLCRLHGLSPADARRLVTRTIAARITEFLHLERVFPDQVSHLRLPASDLQRIQDVISKLKVMSQGALAWYTETSRYIPASRTESRADGADKAASQVPGLIG
ncbi:terpene synthase family protein [Streptomyces sp. NPDC001595]|uniref:terpene synthase family protein n=1 Tax=Streptomyces sp. NPDC001532 TaxID=3154520 RepID=UPI003333EF68